MAQPTFREDYILWEKHGKRGVGPDPANYHSTTKRRIIHKFPDQEAYTAAIKAGIDPHRAAASAPKLVPVSAALSPTSSQFLGPVLPIIGGLAGTAIGTVAGAAGDWIKDKLGGGGSPTVPALPTLPQLPPSSASPPAATPTPGLEGWVQRVLPGGKSGYQNSAIAGLQPVVAVSYEQRATAPPGYVVVTMPDGSKAAMWKPLARSLGLWKARPKPPVSGWDLKAIRRADRAQKKVQNLAGKVGLTTRKRGTARKSTRKKC